MIKLQDRFSLWWNAIILTVQAFLFAVPPNHKSEMKQCHSDDCFQ